MSNTISVGSLKEQVKHYAVGQALFVVLATRSKKHRSALAADIAKDPMLRLAKRYRTGGENSGSGVGKFVLPAAALAALGAAGYGLNRHFSTPNNAGTAMGGGASVGNRLLNSAKAALGMGAAPGGTALNPGEWATALGGGAESLPGLPTALGSPAKPGFGVPNSMKPTDLIPKRRG
jgi:hypothetical protein